MTNAEINKLVNQLVNELETITYYHHHYVRKSGLKKRLKRLLKDWDLIETADDWLIKGKYSGIGEK